MPKDQKVEICNEELNRDCDAEGDVVCSNEYETSEYEKKKIRWWMIL